MRTYWGARQGHPHGWPSLFLMSGVYGVEPRKALINNALHKVLCEADGAQRTTANPAPATKNINALET